MHIDLEDSDVEMVSEEDFINEDGSRPRAIHVQFFLQYVQLSQVMDRIIIENYSANTRLRKSDSSAFTQCDLALTEWLKNCPRALSWNPPHYNFWPAYLQCVYHTAVCLLYRSISAISNIPVPECASEEPSFSIC
jgi:hypothetical protein